MGISKGCNLGRLGSDGPPERKKFSVPDRHFIDMPFVVEGSGIKPPALKEENAINGIIKQKDKARGGDQIERAAATTWLLHLVGDIHQPLHASTRYSENFPTGDRGGNLAMVRINSGATRPFHLDLSRWSVCPNNSFMRWTVIAPAMIIMEPTATIWSV